MGKEKNRQNEDVQLFIQLENDVVDKDESRRTLIVPRNQAEQYQKDWQAWESLSGEEQKSVFIIEGHLAQEQGFDHKFIRSEREVRVALLFDDIRLMEIVDLKKDEE